MKNFTKLLCFLFITQLSFSQTTEDFETETLGGTTFSDNGQNFAIANGPGESTYDVETFASGGWNGTAPDNRFLDNSGAGGAGAPLNDGTSFTISTSDGADILVNNLYLFLSTRTLQVASSTLTITGRRDGATVYTIVKSTGFSSPVTFTPNNGFTLIDFSTEGGSDNSNTAVDELIFSTTGNGDYAAFDAMNWEAIACTDPSVPSLTASANPICAGGSTTLDWAGTSAGDATNWVVYTGTCGTGTQVASLPIGTTSYNTGALASNTTFFVRGEGGCITPGACGSILVTVNPLDNASYSYGAPSYCADATDPIPTITGVAGGTFSAAGTLSLNAATGEIDLSASVPGFYVVTYTTAGTCPNSSNVNVIINALENASFTYSSGAYCIDDTDPSPTITGALGGTFSSGTAGLSISAATGAIDVSLSTPGTYTVTYTTSGTCPNSSDVSVTVNALDDASFFYAAGGYCANDTDPAPTVIGLPGGTFSSNAGLSINASTGVVDLSTSTPGSYAVTYTTSGFCPNSSNVSVTVNALDNATFSYGAASYCSAEADPTPTISGLPGGAFASTAGLSINASTGAIDLSASTPGIYTVTYTTSGICPNSSDESVTVTALDDATFNYSAATYCSNETDPTPTINGTGGGAFTSTAGLSINSTTGVVDLSASTPGTYIVTYTTAGACSNSSTESITVNAAPTAPTVVTPMTICPGDDVILSVTGSGTGNIIFYDNTMTQVASVPMPPVTATYNAGALANGTYVFSATESNGTCETTPLVINVTVGDLVLPTAVCQNINVYLDATGSVTIVSADLDGGSTDNCGPVTFSATQTTFTCADLGANILNLAVIDLTGINVSFCNPTVTVLDTISPVITCPGNQNEVATVNCDFMLPNYLTSVTGTDNCNGVVTFTQSPSAMSLINANTTVTVTGDDGNGNTSTCTFDVILDFSACVGAECSNAEVIGAMDPCGETQTATGSTVGGTSQSVATCGTTAGTGGANWYTFVGDGGDWTMSTVNAGTDYDTKLWVLDGACGSLNCLAGDDDFAGVESQVSISTTIGVTYYVVVGGNSSDEGNYELTFTKVETEAPVADAMSLSDITGVCEITTLTDPTATDNCSAVTVSNDVTLPISSSTTITWTYTDADGNASTQTQEVVLADLVLPTASNPADSMYECVGDAVVDIAVVTDAADNCTGPITVTFVSDTLFGNGCMDTIARTYNVADESGNNIDVVQMIYIQDVTAPTASNPLDLTVQCIGEVPAPSTGWVTDEADNCAAPTVAFVSDVSDGLSCPETISRTFSVSDACGNSINVVQMIIVMDIDAPESDIAALPELTSLCGVTPATATATDNCDGPMDGTSDVTFPITALGTTTITWTYIDACGNTSSQTQDVTISAIDVSVVMASDNITFVANNFLPGSGVTYQWIDCDLDQPIAGETSHNYTPTYGSNFAVIITEAGCSDTSACMPSTVGIDGLDIKTLVLYPNPTNGVLNINYEGEIKSIQVVDLLGRVISTPVSLIEKTVDGSNLTTGKYMIRITTESDQILVEEFVVQK
jgi:hypothetical protein